MILFMKRTILHITFIIGAILFLTRCATVPLTGRHQLILFPEDQMVSMSLTSYSSFLKENKLSTDAVNKQRIKNVGARISKPLNNISPLTDCKTKSLILNGNSTSLPAMNPTHGVCREVRSFSTRVYYLIARMMRESLLSWGMKSLTPWHTTVTSA